jgi:hypothetical protein
VSSTSPAPETPPPDKPSSITPTLQNIRHHEPREFEGGENQGKELVFDRETVNWPRDETGTRPDTTAHPVSLDTVLCGSTNVLVHVRGMGMRFASNRASLGSPAHATTGLTRLVDEFYAFFTWDHAIHHGTTTVIVPDLDGGFARRTYCFADVSAIMVTSVCSVRTSDGCVFETTCAATVVIGPAVANHRDSAVPHAYPYMTDNIHRQLENDERVYEMTEYMRTNRLYGLEGVLKYKAARIDRPLSSRRLPLAIPAHNGPAHRSAHTQ